MIYQAISARNGNLTSEKQHNQACFMLELYMPVASSFGFEQEMEKITNGRALVFMEFSHWQVLAESPYEEGTAKNIVTSIRKDLGLKPDVPIGSDYCDKI